MKTDNRTKYTKKMICDCFLELLKDTPIQRITVKAICDMAEINRSTFYRYYRDPYDLMEQIENDLWNSFQLQIAELSQEDTMQALEGMFLAIRNGRIAYVTLLSENTGTEYMQNMIDRSYELFRPGFQMRRPGLSENELRWTYYFIAQGALSITIDWIRQGMKESPADMARFITELDNCILKHDFP